MQCMSYIDDFVPITASPSLNTNIDRLENAFIRRSHAFNSLGMTIEMSKMELMHFTVKQATPSKGHKPIHFNCLHSLLPNIELHPTRMHTPTYIITPSKEWCYLGFYFDPFLTFSSHCCCYASKALVTTNNLQILGHSLGGVDPTMRKHVYQAVDWSVLSYGLLLWYWINSKGCKAQVKLLVKTQNVALHWISSAFRTTPIPWMELVTGIAPVEQRANYTVRNVLQHGSMLDGRHILNHITQAVRLHPTSHASHSYQRPASNNIGIIRKSIIKVPTLCLTDSITRIGCRLLDFSMCVHIIIPSTPPRASKVFEQWYKAWFQECYDTSRHFHQHRQII